MDALDTFSIPAGTRFRAHAHPAIHAVVVLSGGFQEREKSGWRDVPVGSIRVSAAARHDIDFGQSGTRCLLLEADGRDDPLPALARLPRPRFLAADGWLAEVVRRIERTTRVPDPARATVLDGLSAEFLAQLERHLDGRRTPPPGWLARVRAQIHDTAGRVSVAALAREAGVHRVHLARTFRDHIGVPVTEYARRLRLESAQRLLLTTPTSLAEVAARAGFADQSHLTRVMTRALGTTPGALRQDRRSAQVTSVQDPPAAAR